MTKQDIEKESKKINKDFEIPIDDPKTEAERETPAEMSMKNCLALLKNMLIFSTGGEITRKFAKFGRSG